MFRSFSPQLFGATAVLIMSETSLSETTTSETSISEHHLSEPAATNAALQKALKGREDLLNSIPGIPVILQSLLTELAQPTHTLPKSANW